MSAAKRPLTHSTRPDVETLSFNDIRFCQHYAAHGNAAEAYRQADYRNSKSSDGAVRHAAHDKLTKANIRRYIRLLRQQAADAARVTVDELAVGFTQVAYADRTGVFNPDGTMKPPGEWPAELRSIIAGVEAEDIEEWDDDRKCKVTVGRRWKVKFERSMEARKVLAQWRGMIGSDKSAKVIAETLKVLAGVDEGKV